MLKTFTPNSFPLNFRISPLMCIIEFLLTVLDGMVSLMTHSCNVEIGKRKLVLFVKGFHGNCASRKFLDLNRNKLRNLEWIYVVHPVSVELN